MRNLRVACIVVVALALAAPGVWAEEDEWDVDIETFTEATQGYINPCSNPPQLLIAHSGNHHAHFQLNKTLKDGNWVKSHVKIHTNHQGVAATGYDLALDDDGQPYQEGGQWVRATDDDGNYITTEYQVPGTFNFNKRYDHGQDGLNKQMTFMCNLISHGDTGNLLIHYNGHIKSDADGNITFEQGNFYAKCAGAGPEDNGDIDCDDWPGFCEPPIVTYYGFSVDGY